jgi:hypothetical protein
MRHVRETHLQVGAAVVCAAAVTGAFVLALHHHDPAPTAASSSVQTVTAPAPTPKTVTKTVTKTTTVTIQPQLPDVCREAVTLTKSLEDDLSRQGSIMHGQVERLDSAASDAVQSNFIALAKLQTQVDQALTRADDIGSGVGSSLEHLSNLLYLCNKATH